ncbi:hypothetical protein ADM96_15585 [Burkholderia sp. ST111]|nr:hypothetical protein ADM96_15585 [Burkholderia sp. ST111]
MARIHVRGGLPLAAFRSSNPRVQVNPGDYEAHVVEHTFPGQQAPEAALEILNADGTDSLFVKCAQYTNEIEWDQFPDGAHPYFVPA